MDQPLVFISYSHKDEVEKERLLSHLGVLKPELISFWSDDFLNAGDEWEEAINTAIGQAKVAILLITADYLTSSFILQKEVKLLLDRAKSDGLHVFPIIAKACAWSRVDWLKRMNVRPKKGRPIWSEGGTHVDEDLAAIAEEVADIIERAKGTITPALAPAPADEPEVAVTVSEPGSKAPGATKVLIVENDDKFRRSVIYGLKDMKIAPYEADSVKEAVKILKTDREIRIILLDLKFPGENGTVLLDFIKSRAFYYRVIIFTGYPETFAAEEASAYNVFWYLAKGADAPMQTLRFAVSRAIDDLKREGNDEAENITKRFPTPFVYIYQYLNSEMTPLEKLVSQKDMLELLLHFSAVILLSEYLNSGARNDELDNQIRRRITKPALGDWFNMINEIVNRRSADKEAVFLNSFLEFFNAKNKRILNDFIAVRNKYVGHGTKHSDYEYEDIVQRCTVWLNSLLHDFQFITRFLVCFVLNMQIIRGSYLYTLKECVGANPQLLNSTRPLDLMLNTYEMHLIDVEAEPLKSLSLYPFIILESCSDCRQPEIFFYSKHTGNQLHYISYKTGHWATREDLVPDFLASITPSDIDQL